ncbi:MAG: hypothetical protein IKD93_03465, partial [Firmicutes bacterium]|nr:hypothetical protein [Bacillota bacterium]
SSATTATLSLTLQAKHDGYQYYCKVKDSHGNSVNSNTVKITVGTPLKITTQPANFTGAAGSTATFKVVAQGDGLTYQWYYKKYGASSFVKSTLASGTKATYSMTVANRHDEWQYYCIVKDSYGNSVKSDTVKISVGSPLQIVSQSPQHMTVAVGDNLYIFVEAEDDVLTYQWYYKSATASGFSKSTAESGTTYRYSTEVQAKHDGWQYYCIVKDIHGNSIKSDVFTVSVGETSLRRDQNTPADVTGHIGEPAVFTVAAEGDGLTYQWYYKKAGSDTFAKSTLACAKTDTYSTTIQEKYDGWQYYCVVTDRYGSSLNSRVARLSVGNPLRITTDLNTNYCSAVGYPITFHVAAEGDGLSYQWYSTTADPDNYGYKPVPEASGKTDTFTHVLTEYDKSTSMRVYCVVTDSHGTSVQSYNPVVLVVPPMSITSQTEQARFDSEKGETVQLSVTAYGGDTNKTCQWHFIRKLGKQETDTEVDGEISNTYYGSSNATYTASLPGRYYCVITDGQGNSVTSEEITVVKKIYIITQPTGGSLTVAQPTVDMGLAYGGGLDPLTYQWYHDGNAIPDATDRMYSAAEAGSYYCIVRDAFGDSARTDTVQVTDERDMKVTRQPVGGALPTGSQGLYVDIAVTGGDGSYVYKFYRDGSLQSTKTVNYMYIHDAGQWYIVVQDGSGRSVQSNTFLVRPELQITQQPEGGNIESAGSSVALSVTAADGAPPYTYQWLKNGENISGATYRTYTAASAGNYSVKLTDSAGSWVISDTAVVTETLHITAEPEDKWIKATDSTTLSIGVSGGTGTVTCQWQKYNGSSWINFRTGASINVDGTQFGTYRCVVSDSAGAELISRSVTVAEDVLRIDQKKVVLEGGTQNPYRYYFHVTGGAGGYYSERVYVYTYNWFNWTGELDRITDETGTWFVSSYCYGGDFKVVIHIMDTEGNYVRDFINCTESEIPNTYLHW